MAGSTTRDEWSNVDAGTAVMTALRAIGERLDALEPAALADEPDAVHQLRTHVRRLRSVLAAYAPLFDTSVAEALRRRYGAFGKELGTVRDIEVRVQVADRALEEASEMDEASGEAEAATDAAAAMRARLVDAQLEAYRLAHARFVARERMPLAAARRTALAEFLSSPPLTPLAAESAVTELGGLVEREARRTLRRVRRIGPSADTEELHAVRKAGRRLRYAAEAVSEEPVELFGKRARALASAGEDLHDLLGDHRDEVLFAAHLRRYVAHAAHDGEPVDALERLAAAADRRASGRLSGLDSVVRELRRAEHKWASR
jgi:CHAD domain-containing protein